jgi:uncharacterized protein YjbJ (UPF0337 family)
MTDSTTNTTAPVKANWKDQKAKLITQFPTLTDEDLRYENGKKDEMLTKVQTKIGKTKEELDTIIAGL